MYDHQHSCRQYQLRPNVPMYEHWTTHWHKRDANVHCLRWQRCALLQHTLVLCWCCVLSCRKTKRRSVHWEFIDGTRHRTLLHVLFIHSSNKFLPDYYDATFSAQHFLCSFLVRSHNFRHVFSILIFHTPFITSRFRFDSFSFSVCVLLLFGKLFGFQTLHKRITVDFANILFIAISSWLFFGSWSNSFWPYFVLKIQCVQKIYTKYSLSFSRWWMMVLGEKLQKKYIM